MLEKILAAVAVPAAGSAARFGLAGAWSKAASSAGISLALIITARLLAERERRDGEL